MITRPLDLSSRLRRPPSGYEFIFYVNAGLIVLLFVLFGSRFVLSPGLGLDFVLPVMPASLAGAVGGCRRGQVAPTTRWHAALGLLSPMLGAN